jgi:hypothetical protein
VLPRTRAGRERSRIVETSAGCGERRCVDGEGQPVGPGGEQDGPDRRADDDAQLLDGVQQRVGRAEARLADQARHQRERRWALRASRRGREGGEGDHDLHRAVGRDDGDESEHQRQPQHIAGDQHAAPREAIGDRAANRPEHDVGQQPADRRRADPGGRSGRRVDVAEQRRVVEPVADLRRRARGDQRPSVAYREHIPVCAPATHRARSYCVDLAWCNSAIGARATPSPS